MFDRDERDDRRQVRHHQQLQLGASTFGAANPRAASQRSRAPMTELPRSADQPAH
jgi:hypothetical protein